MKSPDRASYLEESQALTDSSPTSLVAQVHRVGRQLSPSKAKLGECLGWEKRYLQQRTKGQCGGGQEDIYSSFQCVLYN